MTLRLSSLKQRNKFKERLSPPQVGIATTLSNYGFQVAKWVGGALAPNGNIYAAPYNTNTILKIDPIVGTSSTIAINSLSTQNYRGIVCAKNGKLYTIPSGISTDKVLEFDPQNNSYKFFADSVKGSWYDGVLAPNGKIYGIPFSESSILEINPVAGTATTSTISNTKSGYVGGVLGPNGKIYCIPFSATTVLEIDPNVGIASTFGSLPTGTKWAGGVLANNGKIYGAPYGTTSILEIDPISRTVNTFGQLSNIWTDNNPGWGDPQLGSDGKIYAFPIGVGYTVFSALKIDPDNKILSIIKNDSIVPQPIVFGLSWQTTVNNPCNATPWEITNNNLNIRYNIEDSADCGGTCADIQSGTATATITVGTDDVLMGLDFNGIGEAQDAGFERIRFLLDGTLVASAQSNNFDLGCTEFRPVSKTFNTAPPYFLAAGSTHTLLIDFTTGDEYFHVGCFYEVKLSFTIDTQINNEFGGAVSAKNGKIYGIPGNFPSVVSLDIGSVNKSPQWVTKPHEVFPRCGFTTVLSDVGVQTSAYQYVGGCLGNDGNIYGMPYGGFYSNNSKIIKIDPNKETYELKSIVPNYLDAYYNFGASIFSTIQLENGKICGIPASRNRVIFYDPKSDSINETTIYQLNPRSGYERGETVYAWTSGCLAPNGKIYCPPTYGNRILVVNPNTETTSITDFPSIGMSTSYYYGTGSNWFGSALAPNGKIYAVPGGETSVLEIDPVAGTATTFGSLGTSAGKWYGAVLAPNGKIYGIPNTATTILEIDPKNRTATTFGNISTFLSSGEVSFSGVLGADGKIYILPNNHAKIIQLDPESKTLSLYKTLSNNVSTFAGVVAPNGNLYGIPCGWQQTVGSSQVYTQATLISIGTTQTYEPANWMLSSYTNKSF